MLELQYYADKPNRDLTIPHPGAVVWGDVEPGCFESKQELYDFGTLVTSLGFRYGTYGNKPSVSAMFGDSEELAPWSLWYADYRPPDFDTFEPFNGFIIPDLWQFWSGGYCGINCDLSITLEGRLFADISNYTQYLSAKQANYLKLTLDGVIIGLQNADIARQQKGMLI
jgi:hypothetical protein